MSVSSHIKTHFLNPKPPAIQEKNVLTMFEAIQNGAKLQRFEIRVEVRVQGVCFRVDGLGFTVNPDP